MLAVARADIPTMSDPAVPAFFADGGYRCRQSHVSEVKWKVYIRVQ